MTPLVKYNLDFEKSLRYCFEVLENTNELSTQTIKLINFKSGKFFTYLPKDTAKKNLLLFKQGGIALGVRNQMSSILLNSIQSDSKNSCIFDDISSTFDSDLLTYALFASHGFSYKDEVYYIVPSALASEPILIQCLRTSNAIWHSLCMITTANFDGITDKKLNPENFSEICQKVHLIILGAYDGEGYIFWERVE